jgi:hypothetical protein
MGKNRKDVSYLDPPPPPRYPPTPSALTYPVYLSCRITLIKSEIQYSMYCIYALRGIWTIFYFEATCMTCKSLAILCIYFISFNFWVKASETFTFCHACCFLGHKMELTYSTSTAKYRSTRFRKVLGIS